MQHRIAKQTIWLGVLAGGTEDIGDRFKILPKDSVIAVPDEAMKPLGKLTRAVKKGEVEAADDKILSAHIGKETAVSKASQAAGKPAKPAA